MNVCSAVNVLAVYVFGIVVDPWMKELIESFVPIHAPPTEKHPVVRAKPTLDVEVAEPEIDRPERVVVPKPSDEIVMLGVVVVANVVGEVVPM